MMANTMNDGQNLFSRLNSWSNRNSLFQALKIATIKKKLSRIECARKKTRKIERNVSSNITVRNQSKTTNKTARRQDPIQESNEIVKANNNNNNKKEWKNNWMRKREKKIKRQGDNLFKRWWWWWCDGYDDDDWL